jgi:hypothetical protein
VNLDEVSRAAQKALKADPLIRAEIAEWVHDEVTDKWWFVTITRLADAQGLKAAYLRIRLVLAQARLLDRLPLDQIYVIPLSEWDRMKIRMTRESPNLFSLLGLTR